MEGSDAHTMAELVAIVSGDPAMLNGCAQPIGGEDAAAPARPKLEVVPDEPPVPNRDDSESDALNGIGRGSY